MAKMLINGELAEKPKSADGSFVRVGGGFEDRIELGANAKFAAETGRYHLYVSMACPWCHRVTIMLALKELEDHITVTQMEPIMGDESWKIDQSGFEPDAGIERDDFMYQVYQRADANYTGPVTVPVLLDKKTGHIVNTNSADIMRMFNTAFDGLTGDSLDFYPQGLRSEIDRINDLVFVPVNNGVYRAGFATTQTAYDEALETLFRTLDELDGLLGERRYLAGDQITEADWRLFTTLIRFDPVYVTHFKTDRKRIADYANLAPYLRELYQVPGIADTIDMDHIRQHYFQSHKHINPFGIIATGPELDLLKPHGRSN